MSIDPSACLIFIFAPFVIANVSSKSYTLRIFPCCSLSGCFLIGSFFIDLSIGLGFLSRGFSGNVGYESDSGSVGGVVLIPSSQQSQEGNRPWLWSS